MATKYNWSGWDSSVPGTIKDNFDDFRTDDTCPDVNNVETPAPTGGVSALQADLNERMKYRYGYYLPGSQQDIEKPRVAPRIESINLLHTIQMEVFIRGRSSHG